MPNKKFIEEFPLYKKFKDVNLPRSVSEIHKVNIKIHCAICKTSQTFTMRNKYGDGLFPTNIRFYSEQLRLFYKCTHCEEAVQTYYIKVNNIEDDEWVMKVGQSPAWKISSDTNLEKLLGVHTDYFKKGLVCESQCYGIGAFGYYRRIVEVIIDELLDQISDLIPPNELETYNEALALTKNTRVAAEKIELVKDLLPPILRPDGMNPLSLLHSTLSQGLHSETDEECLEKAVHCKEIIIFLIKQITESKQTGTQFTLSMRKLLGKKTPKK